MDLVLKNSNFVNNKYYIAYGTRQQAMFTIVDEAFKGTNNLGVVNLITCLVRQLDVAGNITSASMATMVIGLGDGKAGVASQDPSLRGKVLNKDNMEQCVVTLYEL